MTAEKEPTSTGQAFVQMAQAFGLNLLPWQIDAIAFILDTPAPVPGVSIGLREKMQGRRMSMVIMDESFTWEGP